MSTKQSIAIFAHSAAKAHYLSDIVRMAGYTPTVKDVESEDVILSVVADNVLPHNASKPMLYLGEDLPEAEGVREVPVPLRASELIEMIRATGRSRKDLPAQISFGPFQLDTRENLWISALGKSIRLTEKETSILVILKQSEVPVSREGLLEKVWAYAEGVQTHTLETHIYRLRQKIEEDPNSPAILLTTDKGYTIDL